jgi:uncharacterized protein YhfF
VAATQPRRRRCPNLYRVSNRVSGWNSACAYHHGVGFPVVDGLRAIEFGSPGESRRQLIDFVIKGNKRATAGLLSDYDLEGEPIEDVGELLAIVDDNLSHVATVRVTRVDICRFADVPDEFALAEAEGDLDAADFRASHLACWTATGDVVMDDTLIVQLYFDLLADLHRSETPNSESSPRRA